MYLSVFYLFFILNICIISIFINIYYTFHLLKYELTPTEKIYYFKRYTNIFSENNFIYFFKYFFLSFENNENTIELIKCNEKIINVIETDENKINEIKINELIEEMIEKKIEDTTNLQYFLNNSIIEDEKINVIPVNLVNNDMEILLSDINFETKKKIIKIGKKK